MGTDADGEVGQMVSGVQRHPPPTRYRDDRCCSGGTYDHGPVSTHFIDLPSPADAANLNRMLIGRCGYS